MDVQTLDGDQISEAEGLQTDEAAVDAEIVRLWSAQQDRAAAARKTRDELKAVRRSLAEHLHAMKTLLVQTGRGGRWTPYLREHRIPRATADRYVRQHELTLVPSERNRLSEAISEPSDEDVSRLFQKLLPQMSRILTTQRAAFMFVVELIDGLPSIDGDVLDDGAIVFRSKQGSGSTKSVQNVLPSALEVVA